MALVWHKMLLAGPHRPEMKALAERAFTDAATQFRQMDLPGRAAEMDEMSRSSARFFALTYQPPPKPSELPLSDANASADAFGSPGLSTQGTAKERELRKLQARGVAHERTLAWLAERREKGMDDARCMDLMKEPDQKRIEVLAEILRLISGQDSAFDEDVQAAMLDSKITISSLVKRAIGIVNQS
jgi:hypothetical protein